MYQGRLKVINQFQNNLSIYSHHTHIELFFPLTSNLPLVLHDFFSLMGEHMQTVHKINNLWFTHHHWFSIFYTSIYEVHIAMWQSWNCSNKLNDSNIYALAFFDRFSQLFIMNINRIIKVKSTWKKFSSRLRKDVKWSVNIMR